MSGSQRARGRAERGGGKKRLKGEELTWFRIATRTGCTVQRAKAETTATEFLKWEKFIEDEANDFHRQDWFFARVCYELYLLRLSWTGGKVELKPEDYLIKFQMSREGLDQESSPVRKAVHKKAELTPEQIEAERKRRSEAEANAFLGAFGMQLVDDQPTPIMDTSRFAPRVPSPPRPN